MYTRAKMVKRYASMSYAAKKLADDDIQVKKEKIVSKKVRQRIKRNAKID